MGMLCRFFSVAVWVVAVAPTIVLGNDKDIGETVKGTVPVPVSAID